MMFLLEQCRIWQRLKLPLMGLIISLLTGYPAVALAITITPVTNKIQAIIDNLAGAGVTIENVSIDRISGGSQLARFSNGTENTGSKPKIGIEKGLVMSSGYTESLEDQSKDSYGTRFGSYHGAYTETDLDLGKLLKQQHPLQYDPIIISFDLIPSASNITIDFVFGSDEYEYFVREGEKHIDAYGFFISGPGINGIFSDNAVNVAILPSGDPVSTSYVSRNNNSDYYIPNPDIEFYDGWTSRPYRGNHVALNGWTKVITSYLPVQPEKRYRVKIALGEGVDGRYDSSVFIGQFKSQRQLAGRLFHHKTGPVDETALAEGDELYRYFKNARVVLFDAVGKYLAATQTGPRGEYRFSVEPFKRYQIGVDAATLTGGKLSPEQTWSSQGGLCTDGTDGIRKLKQSGYCYGGKRGGVQDKLNDNNQAAYAEHLILVDEEDASNPGLNFGFSYDVVTNTGSSQGSLRHYIGNANAGAGTGQMLFVPAVSKNSDGSWEITVGHTGWKLEHGADGVTIDGRAYDLINPGQTSSCQPEVTPALILATDRNVPILTLEGGGQSVCNTELAGGKGLGAELIKITKTSDNAIITNNFFNAESGRGVSVGSTSSGNRISNNRYLNTVLNSVPLPIDLGENSSIDANDGKYKANKANRGIDYPVINNVISGNDEYIIEGFAMAGVTLEFYTVQGQDYRYRFSRTEGSEQDKDKATGSYEVDNESIKEQSLFKFIIPASDANLQSGESLTAIAIDAEGNTSEFGPLHKPPVGDVNVTARVFHDLNGDGLQGSAEPSDPADPGIKGIEVRIWPDGEPDKVQTKKTGANGDVTFRELRRLNYWLEVPRVPEGFNELVLGETMDNPKKLTIHNNSANYGASFGYVSVSVEQPLSVALTPEQSKTTAPGLFVKLSHTLATNSEVAASATLSARWISDNGQAWPQWPVGLEKRGCNSDMDDATPITGPLSVSDDSPVCFQAVFFVPAETPQGVLGSLEITATVAPRDASSSPAAAGKKKQGQESVVISVIDRITVSDQGSGRLRLKKSVQNQTLNGPKGTSSEGGSGDVLIYTIEFENIGAGPLKTLKIMDTTPAFTRLSEEAICPKDNLLVGLVNCHVKTLGPDKNAKGFRGRIIWDFDGTLSPGAGGEVSYKLMVE